MKYIGYFFYFLINSLNTRFILPKKIDLYISSFRCFALRIQGAKIGKNVVIREKVFIAFPQNFKIDSNSKIGSSSQIFNYSKVSIGKNCELGPNLYIQTNEHIWVNPNKPIGKQGSSSNNISIGDNVYTGYGVCILSQGFIEGESIIGANSLVNKRLEKGFIYAGSPVKKIKPVYNNQ